MSEQKSIKELKDLVLFIVASAEAIAASAEDGIGVKDLFKFLGVLKAAGPAFKNISEIKVELADFSESEKEELQKLIEKELDLKDDALEGTIEQSLVAAIAILDLIPFFKKA